MFSDGDDVFSYAHYLALFVGRVLWDRGENVQLFLYFHCICVNNTINRSCDSSFLSFFCSCSLRRTIKTKDFKVLTHNNYKLYKKKGKVMVKQYLKKK